jgi:hypothetical protein
MRVALQGFICNTRLTIDQGNGIDQRSDLDNVRTVASGPCEHIGQSLLEAKSIYDHEIRVMDG